MRNSRVDLFNLIKDGEVADPDQIALMIANQCSYLIEEVNETKNAAYARDWIEVADGIADVEFVAAYLKTLAIRAGIDQQAAFEAVCDNNMEKVTTSVELAHQWKAEKEQRGINCIVVETTVDDVRYYTIRRESDNKVLKYEDFPKVNLIPFIPKELLNDK